MKGSYIMNENEEWKYIDWISGIPKDKYKVFRNGKIFGRTRPNSDNWKEIKYRISKSGTPQIRLRGANTIINRTPERLVLWAFKTKKFCTTDVIYKDGNIFNCDVNNLEWDGYSDEYENEEWKYIDWIPGIPKDKYKVSNYGRVINVSKQQLLNQVKVNDCLLVSLNNLPDTTITIYVRKLVAIAFIDIIGYDKEWLDVTYRNRNVKSYLLNHVDNICWTTPQSSVPLEDFIEDPTIPEEWKYIDWLEDVNPEMYKVSNYGRVINTVTNRLVATHINTSVSNSYMEVDLTKDVKTKKAYHASLPRLVAIAFLPKPIFDIKYLVVQPKDGDKTNVRFDNLKWVLAGTQVRDIGIEPEKAVELVGYINEHIYDYTSMLDLQEFINENFSGMGKSTAIKNFRQKSVYGQPERMNDIRNKIIRKHMTNDDFNRISECLIKNKGSITKTRRELNGEFTHGQITHVKQKHRNSGLIMNENIICRKIKLTNIDDGSETFFDSMSAVARSLGCSITTVSRAADKGHILMKKYTACFMNDNKTERHDYGIDVYDVDGNLIESYDSVKECVDKMNIDRDHITRYLDSIHPDKYGFIFKKK